MIDASKSEIKAKLEKFYLETYNQEIGVIVEEPKNPTLGTIRRYQIRERSGIPHCDRGARP